MISRIRQISALGQAVWLDYISRELLRTGRLRELIEEGIVGVTSNPTIFHKAITEGSDYDAEIRALAHTGCKAYDIYETLAMRDIAEAADQLRPVYNESHGRDGYVSLEVNPHLAHDTAGTIAEARRLFHELKRPNVMIKVPATDAGIAAVAALIAEGINVNVTLIFSIDMYKRVMGAYLDGLRALRTSGRSLALVASVASFFVSRVDTLTDSALQNRIEQGEDILEPLIGRAAVANAKIAYACFRDVFESAEFAELRAVGARVQRPLWASTSTKNPNYTATKYIDPLIGRDTVTTVPPQTLEAIRSHASPALTIEHDLDHARAVLDTLAEVALNMQWVTDSLLTDGLRSFSDSFDRLLSDIEAKRELIIRAA